MLAATVLTAVISVALGVLAAVRGGWVDQALQTVSVVAFAVPNFLVGMVLALVFAVELGVFPAVGYVPVTEPPRRGSARSPFRRSRSRWAASPPSPSSRATR